MMRNLNLGQLRYEGAVELAEIKCRLVNRNQCQAGHLSRQIQKELFSILPTLVSLKQ